MRARGFRAGGGEPFGGQARQPRAGVVQGSADVRPARRASTGLAPAGTRGQEPAPDRAARRPRQAVGGWGAPRPVQRAASRSKVSCEVSTATCTSMRGGRAPASPAPAARVGDGPGGRAQPHAALQPLDLALRRPAPGWRRPAGGGRGPAGISPMAVGRTCPRVRVSSAAPTCASRSATCRLMVGGARCRRARGVGEGGSAMATRVRNRSG